MHLLEKISNIAKPLKCQHGLPCIDIINICYF